MEKHIELSLKRTGKEYRALHEWLDGRSLGYKDRLARHDLANIPKFLPVVERKFGKAAADEYIQHLKDDYGNNALLRIFWKIKRIFKK